MKELLEVHFDELLLVVMLLLAGLFYHFHPETKELVLAPFTGALIMALRNKTKNGNGDSK